MYRTSDFSLACYLFAHGLVFGKIERPAKTDRCSFSFIVPDTVCLDALLKLRESPATDEIRTLIRKSKILKAELKNFFNSPEPDDD